MLDQKTLPAQGPSADERRILTDLIKAEKLDQATHYVERLLRTYPDSTMLLRGLGMLHQLKGDTRAAMDALRRLVALNPDDIAAQEQLAQCLSELGEHEDAQTVWQSLLKQEPDNLTGLCGLGSTLNMLGLYHKAADQLERALALDPNNQQIAEVLANTYLESRQHDRAVAHYQALLPKRPEDMVMTLNLADALSRIDRIEEALALCAEVISAAPELVRAHVLKGNIHGMAGDGKKAQASLTKALKLEPRNIAALSAIVQKTKITKANAAKYLPTLEKSLAKKSLEPKQKAICAFALGKAAHDQKDIKKAFTYWKKGNALQLQDTPYDEDRALKRFDVLKHIFAPVNFDALNPQQAHPVPKPGDKQMIFVVGMPRSGTSLTEQILSSHSAVYGAGELNIMSQVTEELMFYFTQQPEVKLIDRAFGSIGRDYMDAVAAMQIDEPYVVDKLPHNFLRLGFIRAAFPDAKIIHTNRDPMAVCWSNWRRFFPAKGMNFGNDLDTVGTYYRHYEDLMGFWRMKFGATIYELDYDRLTHNQEPETRALLDFCGLPFEIACLDFHKTARPVRTASQEQVRRKMYTGSTKEWQAYECHLTPLKKALEQPA